MSMTFSTHRLLLAATLAAAPSAFAQTSPDAGGSIEVTSDASTWIQPASGNGVDIPQGANGVTINNGLGGVINGDPNAIVTAADATTVNNSGTIAGSFNGVNFGPGSTNGVLNNSTTGVVASDSRGVNIEGDGVTVNNAGTIIGTDNQRNGTLYTDDSSTDWTINNSGTIDAGIGNQGSGVGFEIADTGNQGSLVNSGTIQGRIDGSEVSPASGASADGVRLANFAPAGPDADRTFTGRIENLEGGVISSESANGTVAGVRVANGINFNGELLNQGEINGVANGVYFGTGDHSNASVVNEGLITSDSRAFNIDGEGLTVNNAGDILGTANQRNGTLYADGTADNYVVNNSGTIDAGDGNEGSGFGAEIGGAADGANTFTLDNSGTIQGRGDAAAGLSGAGDGVRIGNVGNIGTAEVTATNSGTIASEGANGTVAGVRFVNGISFSGTFENTGDISGVQNGVYFGNPVNGEGADHSNGVFTNAQDGTIASDSRAFNIDGEGLTVNNAGDILGTANQRNGTLYADGTADNYVVNNSGTIDAGDGNVGSGFAAEVQAAGNTLTFDNSGTIQGRGQGDAATGAAGDGFRLGNVGNAGIVTGTVTNSGTIDSQSAVGTTAGLRVVNAVGFQGTITNDADGVIAGVQNGVYFGDADHTGGVLDNAGTITSDSRAFNIDGEGLTVNNSGDILATGRQRNGTLYVDGTATDFAVNNLQGGVISAGQLAGGAGSGVSVEVGDGLDSVQVGSISNAGLIEGAGDLNIDAGVRLFTGETSATFQGDIVNSATGVISANTAPAVLVQSGVLFDGSLINAGTISGGASLATGDATLADTSVLDLAIFAFDSFETFDLEAGTLNLGGTLNIDFAGAFVPQVGQSFDLLDFVASTGTFESINSGFVVLDTSNLSIDGTVSVVSVPEPTSVALGSAAGLVLLGRRRRGAVA